MGIEREMKLSEIVAAGQQGISTSLLCHIHTLLTILQLYTLDIVTCHAYRQPESSRRPTFSQLVEMLSRADFELFAWEEEDLKGCDQRVKVIGAPLELAQNLYTDLQNMYK